MKTKLYWLALIVSAALSTPAQAGNHHVGGGNSAGAAHASARSSAPSFHAMPRGNFGGGRMIYSGQRSFSGGMGPSSNGFRQHYINSGGGVAMGARQFTPGNFNRSSTRFANRGNHVGQITNPAGAGNGAIQNQTGGNHVPRFGNNRPDRLAQLGKGAGEHNGAIGNHRGEAGQVRNGNNLPTNWQNHVASRRSADWHRDWDRNCDHRWHGHHCRFVNGCWFIFDLGFYPWWPYWYDSYAYDYYPYDYYPGDYAAVDDGGSIVVAAQAQLAEQGYYRGTVDGIFGAETRRAVLRYQRDHGLRPTGDLTAGTLNALGLSRVAGNY